MHTPEWLWRQGKGGVNPKGYQPGRTCRSGHTRFTAVMHGKDERRRPEADSVAG
jgi:hypothetical protein